MGQQQGSWGASNLWETLELDCVGTPVVLMTNGCHKSKTKTKSLKTLLSSLSGFTPSPPNPKVVYSLRAVKV